MKPETPIPAVSPENVPNFQSPDYQVERIPNISQPDQGIERSAEHFEQVAEAKALAGDVGTTTILPPPVSVGTRDVSNDHNQTAPITSDTPLLANDEDIIEKEWVNKAKKIVAETKDDPYRREEAVNKLQADYLKKRFGKEIGISD